MKLANTNIRYINPLSFQGNIIDSHVHTGKWCNANYDADMLDVFIKEPLNVNIDGVKQTDTVDKMLVSSLSCIDGNGFLNETDGNIEMLNICKENPKLYPLAVCQPGKTNGNSRIIRGLLDLNEGKFIGLKFHPEGLPLIVSDIKYDSYLDLAKEKGLPCLFHCQDGNSSPEAIYELAKRHPDTPVIMAHLGAGGENNHKRAIDVLLQSIKKGDAKLYADVSWVDWNYGLPSEKPQDIISVIKELKKENALDRLMFGTDAPLGCYGGKPVGNISPKEAYEATVSNLKTSIKKEFGSEADGIIQKIFYDNADELFFKQNWLNKVAEDVKENSGDITKKASKTKTGALIAGAVIAFAGIGTFIFSKIKKDKQAQANDNEQINTAQKTVLSKQIQSPAAKINCYQDIDAFIKSV